ncbi:hypothetical protein QUB10_33325, partial [Microcoleus sp. B5-D4]|uniref:hypothetical protein n=1 Tax=unclassified Microcoleus TaxID=2642155 RepID=UPI002FD32E4E
PSEPSFARKDSESTPNSTELGITRELGSVAGITVEARAKVDLESLLPAQGISIQRDESNNTLSIGAGLGSTRGKLGVNIGAEMGFNPDGTTTLKSASGGVNVAGFGIEGRAGQGGSGGLALTGFGITIDVAKDEKGGISGGISIRLPGGELGIGFQPNGTEIVEVPPPEPYTSPPNSDIETFTAPWTPVYPPKWGKETESPNPPLFPPPPSRPAPPPEPVENKICKMVVVFSSANHYLYWIKDYRYSGDGSVERGSAFVEYDDSGKLTGFVGSYKQYYSWEEYIHYPPRSFYNNVDNPTLVPVPEPSRNWKPSSYFAFVQRQLAGASVVEYWGEERAIYGYLESRVSVQPGWNAIYDTTPHVWYYYSSSSGGKLFYKIVAHWCGDKPTRKPIQLPNYPQQIKPMDCCDKVEEIYKYLGIAKLKKNKFPVSNAFLVPGGKGNDNCIDYYSITQALFRMLANGLIINPKSKPLGSEWQNVNATAWAGQMYEMLAESMSDGNSTQRFEVAAIMQLVQIMSTLAETSRKVEFVADAIGIEPEPVPEELPVCFTVYEKHKGFGKGEPKKLKTSNLKTDEQVEEVLGKMLNPSKIPIVRWQFKPGQISINEALRNG